MDILKYLATFLSVFSGVFLPSKTDLSRWRNVDFTTYNTMRKDKINLSQDFSNFARDIKNATEVAKGRIQWQGKENSIK